MKNTFLFQMIAITISTLTWAHDLNGIWISKDSSHPKRELKVTIAIDEKNLVIGECRTNEEGLQFCAKRNWNLIADGEVWENGKKIGDVFPFALLIYNSHTQMSDLIKIKLINRNEIEYQTVYTNIDGEVDFVWARPIRWTQQ